MKYDNRKKADKLIRSSAAEYLTYVAAAGENGVELRYEEENIIKGSLQMGQLNSLVKLRNNFAHGSVITASINDVKSYYSAGIWILEKLCEVMV